MPYQNEFASSDSLLHLVDSKSVREFEGVIKQGVGQEMHELPTLLEPQRGYRQHKAGGRH